MSKTEWKNNHISGKGEDKNALDTREEMVRRILFHECALDVRWYIKPTRRVAPIWIQSSQLSNRSEWNNCFIKIATKYREFFPTLFVKTTDFQLVVNFE